MSVTQQQFKQTQQAAGNTIDNNRITSTQGRCKPAAVEVLQPVTQMSTIQRRGTKSSSTHPRGRSLDHELQQPERIGSGDLRPVGEDDASRVPWRTPQPKTQSKRPLAYRGAGPRLYGTQASHKTWSDSTTTRN